MTPTPQTLTLAGTTAHIAVCDFRQTSDQALTTLADRYTAAIQNFKSLSPKEVIASQLPEGAHPARKRSYLEGRACLAVLLEANQALQSHSLHLSLTHSRGIAASALTSTSAATPAPKVGIDLELKGRDFSTLKLAQELTPEATQHGLSLRDVWCIKEACFKAAYPALSVFREVLLQSKTEAHASKDPSIRFTFVTIPHPDASIWLAAQAR